MKILSLFLFLFSTVLWDFHEEVTDISAFNVSQKFTEKGGSYFVYTIKNTGNKTVEGIQYRVKFIVNGKIVSFDKSPRTLKPNEEIEYITNKTIYEVNEFNYSLQIKIKDDLQENNTLEGTF